MNRLLPGLLLVTMAFDVNAGVPATHSVPALDNIGLMGLAIAVGLAAGWAIKRKK